MKLLETTALAIRLLSVYFFFKSLAYLFGFFSLLKKFSKNTQFDHIDTFVIIASFGVFFIAAIACYLLPVKLATLLLPKSTDQSPVFKGDLETIQLAAFTIIGVFVLTISLPDILSYIILIHLKSDPQYSSMYENDISRQYWDYSQLFITLFKASIGAYLLFGASGLIGILKKLRTAGSKS